MSNYKKHFRIADEMITHLNTVINNINDPFIASRYVGFVSIAAVSVYELSVKEIFIEFARKKNKVFGEYASTQFKKINGRIKQEQIRNEYIKRFGRKYILRFDKKFELLEKKSINTDNQSIKSAYSSIIDIRNSFAHAGEVPYTVTYNEVVKYYEIGKKMIICLADTMVR